MRSSQKILMLVLFVMSTLGAWAQQNHSIESIQEVIVRNHELMNEIVAMRKEMRSAVVRKQLDSAFAVPTLIDLDKIYYMSSKRRTFLYDLKHLQQAILPSVFFNRKLQKYCGKLFVEESILESHATYCKALRQCLYRADKFVNNKKAYFKYGKFEIPKKYWRSAKKVFQPIMDSVIAISQKLPDIRFKTLILTEGYSGTLNLNDNKVLYARLQKRLMSEQLSQKEMTEYISHARAYALYDVLYDLYKDQRPRLIETNNVQFQFVQKGQGSEPPFTRIKMSATDKRRRVALVKWYILPKL